MKGLINNLPNHDYHADLTHLSSSTLKMLLDGPEGLQKFYEERILKLPREKSSSDVFDFGSLLHAMILEPETVATDFAIYDGWVRRGKEFEIFKAENPGKIIMTKPNMKKAEALMKVYLENQTAVDLVKGVQPEVSLFTQIDGVNIKVRADGLNAEAGYIIDVKTSGFDVDQESFKVTMDRFHYKLSAALYLKAFEEQLGKELEFLFLVIGKESKGCEVFRLSNKSRLEGNEQIAKAIKIYKHCLETGDWTGEAEIKKLERDSYEILEV